MKSDIDALMQEHKIDVLLVSGSAMNNPAMVYLTGGAHITMATLVKERGSTPVLFCGVMERDEAAKSGLPIRLFSDYPYKELLQEAGGDHDGAIALMLRKQLADLGITSGRVAVYGRVEIGPLFSTLRRVEKMLPELEFIGFLNDPIFGEAMMTKEPIEIDRIRTMGKITTEVVGRAADYMTRQRVENEVLIKDNDKPLTVGDVKAKINLWLAELGASNPEDTIFAIGRDAGVPHSAGTETDLIRLGQTIIFDIYPCERGGGYFYDFTRTWSLGYATDEALRLHEQVHQVYHDLISGLKVNQSFQDVQTRTCDLFEAMGHMTVRKDQGAAEGYIHSIGHGVGLNVHEMPFSGLSAGEKDILAPGTVFTIEPGLYYPSRNLGVRLEDTLYTRPDGKFEILVDYPYDLVLPVKK